MCVILERICALREARGTAQGRTFFVLEGIRMLRISSMGFPGFVWDFHEALCLTAVAAVLN